MRIMSMKFTSLFSLLALLFVGIAPSAAQIAGTAQTINASTTVSETLSVSLSSNSIVIPANASNSANITATVLYNLNAASHPTGLFGFSWFGSTTAAMSNGTVNIAAGSMSSNYSWGGVGAAGNAGTACNSSVGIGSITAGVVSLLGAVSGAICSGGIPRLTQAQLTTTPVGTLTDTYNWNYGSALGSTPSTYTGTIYINYGAL